MSKVYREVGITVGMGEYPTNFTTAVIDVMTENDIVKLLIEFPPRYYGYRKIIDIGYITASQVYTVETYELSYSDDEQKYFFFLGRKFTYSEKIYLQFRCLYEDGQESVDAGILKLRFRPALRTADFLSYENNDLETQSEILEKLVIQHANVHASTMHTGHVMIDGTTIVIDENGTISLGSQADTVIAKTEETIQTIAGAGTIIVSNKTITDDDGFIHGIFSYYVPTYIDEDLWYYTNKRDYTKKRIKIFPAKMAVLSEYSPDTNNPNVDWIGTDFYGLESGGLYKFDLSSIPEDATISKAELAVTVQGLDNPTYGYAVPKEVEVHLVGEDIQTPSIGYKVVINSLTDEVLRNQAPIVSVWNVSSDLRVDNSLLKFDFSYLPETYVIVSASMVLTPSDTSNIAGRTIGLYRITSFWDGDAVTWGSKPAYDTVPIQTFIETGTGVDITLDFKDELNTMLKEGITNYGWYMKYVDEYIPETVGDGYQMNFYNPTLTMSILVPSSWEQYNATWNNSRDLVFTAILGTFAATGPYNVETVDLLDAIEMWREEPTANSGIYLKTSTDGFPYATGVSLYYQNASSFVDLNGLTPRLIIEYTDSDEELSDKNVWEVRPLYGYYPDGYESAWEAGAFPDIFVEEDGLVAIVFNAYVYPGVNHNYPLITEPTKAGYFKMNIDGERVIINQISFYPEGVDVVPCMDGKSVKVSSGTEYLFIKTPIEIGEGMKTYIEVHTNTIPTITPYEQPSERRIIPSSAMTVGTSGNDFDNMHIRSYNIGGSEIYMRGLVKFDLSSLGDIPTDKITAAYLWTTTNGGYYSGEYLELKRISSDWNPSTVTWASKPTYSSDYIIMWYDSYGPGYEYQLVLTQQIKDMLDGVYPNYGFYIKYYHEGQLNSNWEASFSVNPLETFLIIEYTEDVESVMEYSKEYTTTLPLTESDYAYETYLENVTDYVGGEAISVGDNVYFSYISSTEIYGLNPHTGLNEYGINFEVRMLSKKGEIWNEQTLYRYPTLFAVDGYYTNYASVTFAAIPYSYPFGKISETYYSEYFYLKMAAISDNDISIIVPSWARYEYSGKMDFLLIHYDGNSWTVEDVHLMDWDTGAVIPLGGTDIKPLSLIYDEDNNLRLLYASVEILFDFAPALYSQIRYAKYGWNNWEQLDYVVDPWNQTNLIKYPDSNHLSACVFKSFYEYAEHYLNPTPLILKKLLG